MLAQSLPDWWLDWKDECVAIVGAGPSANKTDLSILRNRIHVIAINESWKLVPWAEVLYGCDAVWWKIRNGVPEFKGLKISQDPLACTVYPEIKKVDIEDVKSNTLSLGCPGKIGAGGNSGFQAFNLAVQFGVSGIMLIGFDMSVDRGAHWHGYHPQPLNNPDGFNIRRWVSALERTTGLLKSMDIQVINCCLESKITTFTKMTVAQALEKWRL